MSTHPVPSIEERNAAASAARDASDRFTYQQRELRLAGLARAVLTDTRKA